MSISWTARDEKQFQQQQLWYNQISLSFGYSVAWYMRVITVPWQACLNLSLTTPLPYSLLTLRGNSSSSSCSSNCSSSSSSSSSCINNSSNSCSPFPLPYTPPQFDRLADRTSLILIVNSCHRKENLPIFRIRSCDRMKRLHVFFFVWQQKFLRVSHSLDTRRSETLVYHFGQWWQRCDVTHQMVLTATLDCCDLIGTFSGMVSGDPLQMCLLWVEYTRWIYWSFR